jgi:hypothetical protein
MDDPCFTTGGSVPPFSVADVIRAKAELDALVERLNAERRAEILARCEVDPEFRRQVIMASLEAEMDAALRRPLAINFCS